MSKHEEKKSMSENSTTDPKDVKVGSNSVPEKVAVHMFERMRDGGEDSLVVISVGPMAVQQAFHSVIALNAKLASRGQQVVIYPTYEVIREPNGFDKTLYRFALTKREVKLSG